MLLPKSVLGLKHACAKDDARPTLAGIFLREEVGEERKLKAAATDSYILAELTVTQMPHEKYPGRHPVMDEPAPDMIVPLAVFEELSKTVAKKPTLPILTALGALAEVEKNEEGEPVAATFWNTNLETTSTKETRLIQGQFPRLEQFLGPVFDPEAEKVVVSLSVNFLMKICKIAQETLGKNFASPNSREKDTVITLALPVKTRAPLAQPIAFYGRNGEGAELRMLQMPVQLKEAPDCFRQRSECDDCGLSHECSDVTSSRRRQYNDPCPNYPANNGSE